MNEPSWPLVRRRGHRHRDRCCPRRRDHRHRRRVSRGCEVRGRSGHRRGHRVRRRVVQEQGALGCRNGFSDGYRTSGEYASSSHGSDNGLRRGPESDQRGDGLMTGRRLGRPGRGRRTRSHHRRGRTVWPAWPGLSRRWVRTGAVREGGQHNSGHGRGQADHCRGRDLAMPKSNRPYPVDSYPHRRRLWRIAVVGGHRQ